MAGGIQSESQKLPSFIKLKNDAGFPSFIKLKNDAGSEDVHYSLMLKDLPPEFVAVAEKELNETEEKKRKGIQKLKVYLEREGLPNVDDNTLIAVLRNCKYNRKKAENKVKNYLKVRNRIIGKLKQADMKQLENVLDDKAVCFLPYRDKHGRAFFVERANKNYDLYTLEDYVAACLSALLFVWTIPLTSVAGIVYLDDAESPSVSELYLQLKAFKDNIPNVLNLPIRIARMEVINENFLVRLFAKAIRPLLPTKVANRISFYGSEVKNLRKIYHPDLLTEQFGGTMTSTNLNLYKEELMDFIRNLQKESFTLH